jgi:hypothetical protein
VFIPMTVRLVWCGGILRKLGLIFPRTSWVRFLCIPLFLHWALELVMKDDPLEMIKSGFLLHRSAVVAQYPIPRNIRKCDTL